MKRRKEIEEAGGLRAESNSDKIRRNETLEGKTMAERVTVPDMMNAAREARARRSGRCWRVIRRGSGVYV